MRISDRSSDVCSSDLLSMPVATYVPKSRLTRTSVALASKAAHMIGAYFHRHGVTNFDIGRHRVDRECVLPDVNHIDCVRNQEHRSEERRVGKEGVSPCRSSWWRDQEKKKKTKS